MRRYIKIPKISAVLCKAFFINILLVSSATAQAWQILTKPTSETQRSLHFSTADEGWSVGYNGTILHTTDGGTNWSIQISGTSERFLAIRFIDNDIGWAGAGRIIVRTINGGEDWVDIKADPSTSKFRNSLFPVSSKAAWAPANSSGVMRLTRWFSRYTIEDNGTTTEQDFDFIESSAQFYGIYFIGEDDGWSVGLYGQIIRISNASTDSPSFSYQTSGTSVRLNAVFMLDANSGWIVGDSGTILKTTDGGATWPPVTSGTSTNLRGVHFINSEEGWVVGDEGLILATQDGGDNWNPQLSGVTTTLCSVFFNNLGFIAGGDLTGGENGAILRYGEPLAHLDITRPDGGEVLFKGEVFTITWSSRNVAGTIQIDLYKGGSAPQYLFRQVAAGAPNTGSYPATLPDDIPNGSDYLIRISTNGGNTEDFSKTFFTIADTHDQGTFYTIRNKKGGTAVIHLE
jgi:photosystem II stability/assembly factor-like uncharacterized protein